MNWAHFTCLTAEEDGGTAIPITGDVFTVGRALSCDLSVPDTKVISGKHCRISKEDDNIWIEDLSFNGTWLNGILIGKGQKRRLNHGDEIAIVNYSGKRSSQNIAYKFEEINKLDETQPLGDSDEDENTEDYLLDKSITETDSRKRKNEDGSQDEGQPAAKRQELDAEKEEDKEEKGLELPDKSKDEYFAKGIDDDGNEYKIEGKGDDSSKEQERDETEGVVKEGKEEESTKQDEGKDKGTKDDDEDKDDIMETLICSICQDILHKCTSLQPCMHSFCEACISGWMNHSKRCPTCRKCIKRVGHNYIVNSLVDAYLKQHPEKRRPQEELDEMDAQKKVPFNQTIEADIDDDDDEGDYDPSDDEYDDGSSSGVENQPHSIIFGGGMPLWQPPRPRACRQCAHYIQPLNRTLVTTSSSSDDADHASTSTASTAASSSDNQPTRIAIGGIAVPMPTAPQYQCRANIINHTLCTCCYEPMPVRTPADDLPPQKCCVCLRNYCHMYWGCWKQNCLGCLNKFKDMKFNETVLDTLINNNRYESTIFKDFMMSQGASNVSAILQKSLDKLNSGDISTQETQRCNMNSESAVCYTCALKIFQQLAYKYRASIPREDLPVLVTAREDCHWGKNCRTQFNKPHHAANFSHICEQTRF